MTPTSSTRSPAERHLDRAAALLCAWQDRDRFDPAEPTLGQRIAAALAAAEAEAEARGREQGHAEGVRAALDLVHELFAGGPDTSCRTVWDESQAVPELGVGPLECVSVPLDDLRATLDAVAALLPDDEPPGRPL